MVNGFFDVENRLDYLTANGDILPTLKNLIPWEDFRSELEVIYDHERKSNAGRRPFDVVMMFKQLHYLLIEAAWRAVRYNLEYKARYGALVARGMNSKKAIVVIARKLMQTIRAVWLQNRKYVNLMPGAKMN